MSPHKHGSKDIPLTSPYHRQYPDAPDISFLQSPHFGGHFSRFLRNKGSRQKSASTQTPLPSGRETGRKKRSWGAHSDHDQDQQDDPHQVFTVWKPSSCDHGKNIPRAGSCELSVYTCDAGKQDQGQYDIFDFLKSVDQLSERAGFFFYENISSRSRKSLRTRHRRKIRTHTHIHRNVFRKSR